MKRYKLRFSYSACRPEQPIYDYNQQEFISIDDCNRLYGEEITKKVCIDQPGRVVTSGEVERAPRASVTVASWLKQQA